MSAAKPVLTYVRHADGSVTLTVKHAGETRSQTLTAEQVQRFLILPASEG